MRIGDHCYVLAVEVSHGRVVGGTRTQPARSIVSHVERFHLTLWADDPADARRTALMRAAENAAAGDDVLAIRVEVADA